MNKNKAIKMEHSKSENPVLAKVFAKRLHDLRKARQLSQYALADELGVSRPQISHWESEKNNPTLETIERLATFFNVPPLSFFEDDHEAPKTGRSRLEQQVQKIKHLSNQKQKMISNMLEAALNTN